MINIELTGSEKQVAWAVSIREFFQNQFDRVIEAYDYWSEEKSDKETRAIIRNRMLGLISEIMSNTTAAYWIKNRDSEAIAMMRKLWFEKTGTYDYKII